MKFDFATVNMPAEEGSAAGRILLALLDGLTAAGQDVRVASFHAEPAPPNLPDSVEWVRVPSGHALATHARAVVNPRSAVLRTSWTPRPDAIPVAVEPYAAPLVTRSPRSVLLLHYLTRLDHRALRRFRPADVQDRRAERRAIRRSRLVLAMSTRVAAAAGQADHHAVPVAIRPPAQRVTPVEEPVAAVLANWHWAPNALVLDRLLASWDAVRTRVPGARLFLAGGGLGGVGTIPGVEVLGRVGRSIDVLSRAAVVPLPLPGTSGPKVKVVEALGAGLPVLTTAAGVEGLHRSCEDGVMVTTAATFEDDLVALLDDAPRRAQLAGAAVEAISTHHTPDVLAAAWLTACRDAGLGDDLGDEISSPAD
jgi:glycosyltransferase involved in cell wall biosynthesis